jgi:hypothetical protein
MPLVLNTRLVFNVRRRRHRHHERQGRSHNKGQGCRRKAATLPRPEKHHNPNGVAHDYAQHWFLAVLNDWFSRNDATDATKRTERDFRKNHQLVEFH